MDSAKNTDHKIAAKKGFFLRLLPILLILAGFAAFFAFRLDQYLSFDALRENRQDLLAWRQSNRLAAALSFIAVYCLVVAFSVPGAVWMTIAGGFLFGTVQATFLAVVGATLGAIIIFLAARYAFSDYLHAKAGPFLLRMEEGFKDNALSYLLFLRLIPLFPFWLVNLVPAFLNVPLGTFIFGTFFGIIPGAIVFSSVGNGLGSVFDSGGTPRLDILFDPEILFPIFGLAVLALIPIAYKKFKE